MRFSLSVLFQFKHFLADLKLVQDKDNQDAIEKLQTYMIQETGTNVREMNLPLNKNVAHFAKNPCFFRKFFEIALVMITLGVILFFHLTKHLPTLERHPINPCIE